MRQELLEFLVDPLDRKSRFSLFEIKEKNGEEVIEATLKSAKGSCYPVVKGIPRILSDNLLAQLTPVSAEWLQLYRPELSKGIKSKNIQISVAGSFAAEWKMFNKPVKDYDNIVNSYFWLWKDRHKYGEYVLDAGCGMGRWAKFAANKCGRLFCVDISQAIDLAQEYLKAEENIFFIQADLTNLSFCDNFFCSVYSLGVLHHIPDTKRAFRELARTLKKNGSLLTYMYYSLDNRPIWFKLVFSIVNICRLAISRLPRTIAYFLSFLLTIFVYLPLMFLGNILDFIGMSRYANRLPLYEGYRGKSPHILYNDSIDRFTTPLEKRFSKREIIAMYAGLGFKEIIVQDKIPYWVTTADKV